MDCQSLEVVRQGGRAIGLYNALNGSLNCEPEHLSAAFIADCDSLPSGFLFAKPHCHGGRRKPFSLAKDGF